MKNVQAGQLSSAGLLYERYKLHLYNYFFKCCGKRSISEDLVQSTFEKLIRYSANFQGTGSFKSWLFAIARNAYIDDYKKRGRRQTKAIDEIIEAVPDSKMTGEQQLIKQQRTELLQKALLRLSPENRALLALVKLQEKKYKEVAESFQMKESTLKVKIFRIIKELQQYMREIQAEQHY